MAIMEIAVISAVATLTGVAFAWTALQMTLKAVAVRVRNDRR